MAVNPAFQPAKPKVTKENYQGTLASLWALTALIDDAPIAEMLATAERADSVGHILDPTLYLEKAKAMHEDMEMLGALEHVQRVVGRIRQRKAGA